MEFSFVDIGNRRYIRDQEPDECPLCHFSVKPEEKVWKLAPSSQEEKKILEVVYECPRENCQRYFVARYLRTEPTRPFASGVKSEVGVFRLVELTPSSPPEPEIPSEVVDISPLFLEIYTQALAAESYDLDQVAGVGYRKALEFLIKDYCISLNKDKEIKIKAAYLSTCIKDFVESPQVKLCAERATWLGNDETHYVRKWIAKDINSLKELIILTINWIQSDILTSKYASDMPN